MDFFACSDFLDVLMGVWTRDGSEVLAEVDFFLAEDLGMRAFMKVVILGGIGGQ